MQGTVVTI